MIARLITILILMASLLSACNTPQAQQPTSAPAQDAVATQVSRMLTSMPTPTLPFPTDTPAPTNTRLPNTPTPPEPTQTPTETPPAPTETQTVTATLSSSDPAAAFGQPIWQTSFDTANVFGIIDNDNTRIHQENGALVMTAVNPNGWLGWSLTFSKQPKDFYLEATIKTGACSGNDQYGLMFRAPNAEDGGYFYGITCAGNYFLRAADFANNTDFFPLAASSSSIIQAGSEQTNRFGVMAKGNAISLYANGKLLNEVNDFTFSDKGFFGGFITAYQTAGFTVQIESISLWNIP